MTQKNQTIVNQHTLESPVAPLFLTKFAKSTFWMVGRFLPCGVAGVEGEAIGEGGQGGLGRTGDGMGPKTGSCMGAFGFGEA